MVPEAFIGAALSNFIRVSGEAGGWESIESARSVAGFKLEPMMLKEAVDSDYAAIVDLANLAFRGTGPTASWNIETWNY